jgi:hypothetical protein
VLLDVANVHYGPYENNIGEVNEIKSEESEGKENEDEEINSNKAIGAGNPQAIESPLGIPARYDLTSSGTVTLDLGHQPDFRRFISGNVKLSIDSDGPEYAGSHD